MASKFGGLLATLELKENDEVHYNMNFLEFFKYKFTKIVF
jgi:hypothetical protein